ncbi:MAG: DNA mismatch repair endonuclease MutL [Bacillota bacterium]
MKINILDSTIYNRISAGEVVENPASIVKELVENSIDAGASTVSVHIKHGGIKSIEVVDNGCGIPKEELYKTVLPHATSKIDSADDLNTISTLGFRGEALASISAVSEFSIKSKYMQSDIGAEIVFINNKSTLNDAAITNGTVVSVKNLFFNVPARFKFLKAKHHEENYVTSVITNIILSNPDIAINFYADDELKISSAGDGLMGAIKAVYPPKISENLIAVDYESTNNIFVKGYISDSSVHKNTRGSQTIIVNGRVISDQTISASVQNAYGERLMHRCFPIFVLSIIMPFDEVDINVHPNKREVRFSNGRSVAGAVYHAVKEALEYVEFSRQEDLFKKHSTIIEDVVIKNEESTPTLFVKPIEQDEKKQAVEFPKFSDIIVEKEVDIPPFYMLKSGDTQHNEHKDFIFNNNTAVSLNQKIEPTPQVDIVKVEPKAHIETQFSIVGQAFNTYILVECGEKLIMIDQHATHERLLYDKLMAAKSDTIAVQSMLMPYIFESSANEINKILSVKNELDAMGFEIEEFGANAIRISAVPVDLCDIDCEKFIADILKSNVEVSGMSTILKDKLARVACRAAIKGGDCLNKQQIAIVMDYFVHNNMPLRCPHGRPTYIEYSKSEIEKLFRRRV